MIEEPEQIIETPITPNSSQQKLSDFLGQIENSPINYFEFTINDEKIVTQTLTFPAMKDPSLVPVIVIITGNPGVASFYRNFMKHLYSLCGGKYTITTIGHTNHVASEKNKNQIFTLEDQIHHKVKYLESLGKDRKVILIGHSIGCWMILKLMKRYPSQFNIMQAIHLFPTFRHLWDGMNPAVKIVIQPYVRKWVGNIAHYSPRWLLRSVLSLSSELSNEAKYVVEESANYYNVLNILSMGHQEAQEILHVDEECEQSIRLHCNKHWFLYGKYDKYAPEAFYNDLKRNFPELKNVELCSNDEILHAFVLHHSKHVAEYIFSWLPN